MKVYIASKYIKHTEINNKIHDELKKANIDAFLPKNIDIDALSKEEMFTVAEICYDEIMKSDVVLFVCPFGVSVSCEAGCAATIKRVINPSKKIVVLGNDYDLERLIYSEAMIYPYVDKTVHTIPELLDYLKSLNR